MPRPAHYREWAGPLRPCACRPQLKRDSLGGQLQPASDTREARMRRVRLLPFFALAVATATARAQDSTSLRDTLAYTTAIVTVRAKPFANARALGRVDAAVPVRLYTCSVGWCTVATGRLPATSSRSTSARGQPRHRNARDRDTPTPAASGFPHRHEHLMTVRQRVPPPAAAMGLIVSVAAGAVHAHIMVGSRSGFIDRRWPPNMRLKLSGARVGRIALPRWLAFLSATRSPYAPGHCARSLSAIR